MTRRRTCGASLLLALVSLLGGARLASAQLVGGADVDDTKARELAQEAWRLTELQRHAEACALYRQALALKSSPGLLNAVGLCFDREGDAPRALMTFEQSLRLAEQQAPGAKRDAWEKLARRELSGLEARLGRLVLHWPQLPGLRVQIDGKLIETGVASLAVRPGLHRLEASAPDRLSRELPLRVDAGARLEVQVPQLAPVAPPAAPAADAPEPRPARTLPWVLVGAGSAALAAGVVTGVVATVKDRELDRSCSPGGCPDGSWQSKIDSARTFASVTNVLWGVGLGALGVGVTLFIADGDPAAGEAALQAACHAGSCGLRLDGRF